MAVAAKLRTVPRERRRFGRRETYLHAWVSGPWLPEIACIVRNLSERGALLETEYACRLPNRFHLRFETIAFEAECEVRHRQDAAVGVYFLIDDPES